MRSIFRFQWAAIATASVVLLVFDAAPAMACGTPLTVQDIQNGIMPSEANMPCSSSRGSGSGSSSGSSSQRLQGPSESYLRHQKASRLNSMASDAQDRGDYAEALNLFRQARALLLANGDSANAAIVERNMSGVQKQYDAVKSDNRVAEALSKYANQNVYNNTTNPFASPPPATNTPTGNGYDPRSGCSTITGTGMADSRPANCGNSGNSSGRSTPTRLATSDGKTQKVNKPNSPRPTNWQRGGVAPDVQNEIMNLGDQIAEKSSDDPQRAKLVEALHRRLALHHVPVKKEDIACLSPTSGVDKRGVPIRLGWKPEHIKKEAIDQSGLCDFVKEGDAKEACRDDKYGQAVMWAEPEIAGQCRTATMPGQALDAVAECAKRKFDAAWAIKGANRGILQAPMPSNWVAPAGCARDASASLRKETLRDILRRRLNDAAQRRDDTITETETPPPDTTVSDGATPPPPPPDKDDDEAYCDFMARATVRGELTVGSNTTIPPGCKATIAAAESLKAKRASEGAGTFTMDSDETDREIKHLMGETSADGKLFK
jgi:hypothetical protein